MFYEITWFSFLQWLVGLTVAYYLCYIWDWWRRGRSPKAPPEPPPSARAPEKEVWMEDILLELEKTVRHAERLHYHPDEVILLLQKKIKTIKSDLI